MVRVIARLNVGGPAKHVVWLTAGLQQFGFDTLLVTGSVADGEEDMSYFADESNVKPYYIREMRREISWRDLVTIWKLYRLFLRERPDIVHTHTAKAGTVGRVAGFLYRWLTLSVLIGRPRECKFVHTYHGHIFHSYYGRFKTGLFILIERVLARTVTDRLICLSQQQQDEISSHFRVGRDRQFTVLPLGLDLKFFDNALTRRQLFRKELNVSDETTLVGIVGRLTDVKNHALFLRSVARFKQLAKDDLDGKVKFVVIGDGSMRGQLERMTASLGLQDDVMFVGNRRDARNFYPALDIVALTSKNEGTPLTLIEAMANARPIIATTVGGVVDLLGEPLPTNINYRECTRGISVNPNDEEGFASGLVRLVKDVELRTRLGKNGTDFVKQNHSKDRLIENVRDLYTGLLAASSTSVETTSAEQSLHSRASEY